MADQPLWSTTDKDTGSTISNGDLTATQAASNAGTTRSSRGLTTGKFYVEIDLTTSTDTGLRCGIATSAASLTVAPGGDVNGWSIRGDGQKVTNGGSVAYGNSIDNPLRIAVDIGAGKVWFGEGTSTWFNSGDPAAGTGEAFSGITGTIHLAFGANNSVNTKVGTLRAIASYGGTAPSGFIAGWGYGGTAALTEDADTTTATGTVAIKAAAAVTETDDSTSAAGALAIKAASATTEADDTVAATGQHVTSAAADITEADDTVSATATLAIAGTAALTEADDATTATGNLPIVGENALTETDDSVSAAATLLVQGSAALADTNDSVSATGTLYITGLADLIEADDTVDANDFVPWGRVDATEADDYLAFTGRVPLEWLDRLATAHDVPNRTLCAVCARVVLPEEMHRQVRRIAQRLVWTGLYTCRTCVDIPGDPPPIHRHADPKPVPNARPSRS